MRRKISGDTDVLQGRLRHILILTTLSVFLSTVVWAEDGARSKGESFWEIAKGFSLGKPRDKGELSDADYADLGRAGVQLVRINLPVTRCEGCPFFELAPRALAYADKAVDAAQKYGYKVVVALEPQPAGDKADYWFSETLLESIEEQWAKLAARYKSNPAVAAFDLINEPVIRGRSIREQNELWSQVAVRLIDRVRTEDPGRLVIFEPAPWGLPKGFTALAPIPRAGVVYSFHLYEPHKLTHQGIHHYPRGVRYPGVVQGQGRWDKNRLGSLVAPVREFSKRHKVPVYVGEFSCIRWADPESRINYIRDAIDVFRLAQWSWTYHSFRAYTGWDAEVDGDDQNEATRRPNAAIWKLLVEDIGNK